MRINWIKLKNIRSYKQQEVQFKEGSTLLSGDIGSGKTSILLAIEFALFGLQPGQKGTSLLRNGENEGGVEMSFSVDDQEIVIERNLKRSSKSITQDYCTLNEGQEKREISVSELKNFVLDFLNYPKEFAKKQNILYKFTVYTPQEEMKQIILEDSTTRLNTLRHVFGVDKYKTILENTSLLVARLREEKKVKEGAILSLPQDKENFTSKESLVLRKKEELILVEKEVSFKRIIRDDAQRSKEEISKRIEEKNILQNEIEKTKLMISTKSDSISFNSKTIHQLQLQVEELSKLKVEESEIKATQEKLVSFKLEKVAINEVYVSISSQISSLNLKNQENQKLKEKLSHLDMCPTCLQDVNVVYKTNVINQTDSDIVENNKKIVEISMQKKEIQEKMIKIEQGINNLQLKINEFNLLKFKIQSLEEKKQRIADLNLNNDHLTKDIELLTQHVDSLNNSIFELKKFETVFIQKREELEKAVLEERKSEIKLAEIKKEIELLTIQILELANRILNTEDIQKQLNYLLSLEDWLVNKFMPVISFIEKNVMVKLKTDFEKLFAEWFLMLVSESFNVRLNDDFTPIIEQQDYEIDYAYLSGGERTAVALAYRLALNQVINSLLSKIKTKDLVILDEPTDGFSEQQLDKMRDVLQELKIDQLIIVSHEQKIEGFVNNVIKLKKEKGLTSEA